MNAAKIIVAVAGLMLCLCLPFACISWGGEPKPDVERVVTTEWVITWDGHGWTLREGQPIQLHERWRSAGAAWIGFTHPVSHDNFHPVVPWLDIERHTKVVKLP